MDGMQLFRLMLGAGVALMVSIPLAGEQVHAVGEQIDAKVEVDALARPQPAHPHRIVVKYGSQVTECAHCLLARVVPFATVTGTDSLDRLNRRFRVRGMRGLFSHDHGRGGRAAKSRGAMDAVRARFPLRASRAPAKAVAPDLSNVYVVDLAPGVDPAAAAAAFTADPNVVYAEPDYQMHTSLVPNDPYFSSTGSWGRSFPDLWGLHATQADQAWDITRGDGIVVAVVDTGVNYLHKDLANNVWTNPGEIPHNHIDDDGNGYIDDVYGWDFTTNKNRPKDRHGHGTHVAGTIAATGNNALGVVGMAWGARVMAVRGLDARGSGWSSDLAKGILYAAQNGADVLNNSWGGPSSSAVNDAIAAATSLGAIVVFAAGNDSSTYIGQAANPNVIAVAATDANGQRASFSNYGNQISVAAPGVEILSLRGPARVGGITVGRRYRVLSGTSMASPHVAGVVALLLAQQPTLTADEVRWHLELNADQPGATGYEGQPWNPYFGWGQVNAARVFNAPPVTTRISSGPITLHGLPDTVEPGTSNIDFLFTTLDLVAWSISAPAWLTPATPSGTGAATVSLGFVSAGLTVGTYTDAVTVSAPAAADGGGNVGVTAYVHRDNRVGGQVTVSNSYYPSGSVTPPRVASDGQGALAVWVEWPPGSPSLLTGAYVDDGGNVTGPFVINTGTCDFFCSKKDPAAVAVAYDGTNFLVVWVESIEDFVSELSLKTKNYQRVKAARVTRSGQVLDTTPIEVALNVEKENNFGGFYQHYYNLGVAFDGTAYTVLWGMLDYGSSLQPIQVFLGRVGPDGSLTPVHKISPVVGAPYPWYMRPKIACVSGSCLLAWTERDGETTPEGKYIDKLFAQRFVGDVALDPAPFRILTDISSIDVITSSSAGYLVAGWRANLLPGPERAWGYDVVGARVSTGGTALDPSGIRLNNSPPEGSTYLVTPNGAVFDGTDYIVTWAELGSPTTYPLYYPFATRVGLDGSVLGNEPEGFLLTSRAAVHWNEPIIAPSATKSLVMWVDGDSSPARIVSQGVFAH